MEKEIKNKNVLIWLHWVLDATCGIHLPNQGLNPGPLRWECSVSATGPPGYSLESVVFWWAVGTLSQEGGGAVGDVAAVSVPHAVTLAVVPTGAGRDLGSSMVHKVPAMGGGKFGCLARV